ncbi:hypothetical protein A3C59_00165 [Candidatus Daviesbacteria bacterium RIFCSPHIGHO2_02_FULL_36_13]|uniref:Uncharacterized protein n=1 Tax=Candidatus Daviesbacteria bacterium RIFCSPHIGHO2_02_FULL_36_13 TaxID=1797768 RepID=A0A1F5JYY4_9BACT|nr:MAG: hypothetical protein A3C59_00165 [Candidatus Daviesbacteria bacterium RIFCSPHIGHO2_02_FULL_36_13]
MTNPFAFLNDQETEREAPLEIEWERMAEGAIKGIAQGVQEVGKVAVETVQEVGAFSKGSIPFNLESDPNVAKTPELIEAEKAQAEAQREQNFFDTTAVDQNKVAQTAGLREAQASKAIEFNTKINRSNVMFMDIFNIDGSLNLNEYNEGLEKTADSEINKGNVIFSERGFAIAQEKGASAINASTEGGAGEINPEIQGGPKTSLSAVNAGG